MTGNIVNATSLDSVRIELLGVGRAVQIPAQAILAVDTVLRYCVMEEDYSFLLWGTFEHDAEWKAYTVREKEGEADERIVGRGDTPWSALIALAEEIERRRTTR